MTCDCWLNIAQETLKYVHQITFEKFGHPKFGWINRFRKLDWKFGNAFNNIILGPG